MSYEKVKNMSIKKDGTITATLASNNLRPIRYETVELFMDKKKDFTLDEKLRVIFNNLFGRELQFNHSSTSKVFYAYLKALEYFRKTYDYTITDLWVSKYDKSPVVTPEESARIQNEMYGRFKIHLMDKVYLTKRDYGVLMDSGNWLYSSSKTRYRTTGRHLKSFHLNQALTYSMMYDCKVVHVDDITE